MRAMVKRRVLYPEEGLTFRLLAVYFYFTGRRDCFLLVDVVDVVDVIIVVVVTKA